MKLYHGSLEQVDKPEIREASRTLDYGKGFYATTSFEQAENWVRRKAQELNVGKGYVNVYEFDESALRKIANDRVYAAFALYEGGVLDKEELKRELKTYKLVDQYLFHTLQSLRFLVFVEAKEVAL